MDTGLKSSEGKTTQDVLLDVLEAFGKYDLESAEGTKQAIKDIEAKVGEVANIEGHRTILKKERLSPWYRADCGRVHTIPAPEKGYMSKFMITAISRLLNKIP